MDVEQRDQMVVKGFRTLSKFINLESKYYIVMHRNSISVVNRNKLVDHLFMEERKRERGNKREREIERDCIKSNNIRVRTISDELSSHQK